MKGKNWPHSQNQDASLVAHVHESKWLVYLSGKEPKSWTNAMSWEGLCVYLSVVGGYHIYKEVWTPRTGEELLVEIVDIVLLQFASDEAAGWKVDILEPLFYSYVRPVHRN